MECDLPGVSGDATIEVGPNTTADYELFVRPLLGGEYSGAITFIAPDGSFIWYTIEIFADAPSCEDTLELRAFVRKAVAVEIGLANPLNEPVEFEVRLTGNGLLEEEVLYWEQKVWYIRITVFTASSGRRNGIDCICKSACRRGLVRAKINC